MSISLLAVAIARQRDNNNSQYEPYFPSEAEKEWLKEMEKKNFKFWMKVLIPIIVICIIVLIVVK